MNKKSVLLTVVMSLVSLLGGAARGGVISTSYQVSAGADDGYAWSATGQDIGSGYLLIGDEDYSTPYHISAMRFTGLDIPRSAAILEAHLRIRSIDEETGGQIYGIIEAEAADDAEDFSSRYIGSAAKTAAAVGWDHTKAWDKNTWYTSDDISSLITEVVDRGGWGKGNSLAILYSTRADSDKSRKFSSFELGAAYGAVLEITYETYTISGYILDGEGGGLSGVNVSAGSDIEGAVTDGDGYYELEVPAHWFGVVTPSKAGWAFIPVSRTYSMVTSDQANQDYTGFQPEISGYIRDSQGVGIEGVLVTADNGGGSDTTGVDGYYEVIVPYEWSGVVTPSKTDWGFIPPSRSYSNLTSDMTEQNYLGLHPKISGGIWDGQGIRIEGVLVTADNGGGSDTTDEGGYYDINVPYGWSGAVTPSKADWGFSPESRSYSNVTNNQVNQSYVGFQPEISGYITDREGAGVEGVLVTADNGGGSDTTGPDGYYEITVVYGWSGVVTPVKAGWDLSPSSRSYTNVTGDLTGQDYSGFQPKISGHIRDNEGVGVEGILVSADNGGGSDTTDSGGYYEVIVPYEWSGVVTPSKYSWLFIPESRSYSNVTGDLENEDYTTSCSPWLGNGDVNEPYQIWDVNDMQAIGAEPNYWGASFRLMADIDLSSFTGTMYNIIGNYDDPFEGVFDGNSHVISNFTYNSEGASYTGVFGHISGFAEVKNLGLLNPDVNAGTGDYVGALAGSSYVGSVGNCYVEGGSVTGDRYVGGLTGVSRRSIFNSYSSSSVTGNEYVGGLTGYSSAAIYYCYSTGSVSGTDDVGGLVGQSTKLAVGSYWDIETSGIDYSATGAGLTTAQMQSLSTYLAGGWGGCGNESEWTIDDGNDYPRLAWEGQAGVAIGGELSDFLEGAGTAAEPYLIYNPSQLNMVGAFPCELDKHFKLMADIDLGAYTGTSFNIIGTDYNFFTGVFDGNGHTISNFTYNTEGIAHIGLFGRVSEPNAEVKNLGLIDPNVSAGIEEGGFGCLIGALTEGSVSDCYVEGGSVEGGQVVGGLVGWNNGGEIQGCHSTSSVTGHQENVGGLVGLNDYHSTISNCYSTGEIAGEDWVGGLVGSNNDESSIIDSYSTGDVTGHTIVGGLVGNNDYTISRCYSTCSVIGIDYVGGLVGGNLSEIISSYATGSVSGSSETGGLVGHNSRGNISNSYSAGPVSGVDRTGGLVGYLYDGEVEGCFWDIDTSGQTESDGGVGKSTEQMQSAILYSGWACYDEAWTIDDGVDYPHLVWEGAAGELITKPVYGGGTGEPNEPYLIYTAEQLSVIGVVPCDMGKHFKLMADIDLSAYTGTDFNPIGSESFGYFRGMFDGNSHVISNFTYDSNGVSYVGLFGHILDPNRNAEIRDLGLINPEVNAVNGDHIGSIAGFAGFCKIRRCWSKGGSVSGGNYVGGFAGSSDRDIGIISNCYCENSVTGVFAVGGLVGGNGFPIVNCYSTGSVTGDDRVGGLVGDQTACGGDAINSFWDVNSSGVEWSAVGTGLTTAQMQTMVTYVDAGWDFTMLWTIDEGSDYPRLCWEGCGCIKYGGGGGTEEEPYLIYTGQQMYLIGTAPNDWDNHFRLMADIDLGHYTGTDTRIIGNDEDRFTGSFDGGGHTIANFNYYNPFSSRYLGLFGVLGEGEIRNLGLIDPNISAVGGSSVGVLVGDLWDDGSLSSCYVEGGSITGYRGTGGLVGWNSGSILDCYSTCSVTGDDSVGGLVGYGTGNISNSYSTGSVTGDDSVGGLVGNNDGEIQGCYSRGSVTGDYRVGGLVGYDSGNISNSYSTGSVTGNEDVGGLAGYNRSVVFNCYSSGSVAGDVNVGGLVGCDYNLYSDYTASFWDSDVNPDVNGIGNIDEPNVVGLPTALMQTMSTFTDAGWDFVAETVNGPNDIWDICEGTNYPKLVWSIPAGDFICPDGVNMIDFAVLGEAWFSDPNMPNWDPACDISEPADEVIDGLDLEVFVGNWLESL